MAVFVTDLDGGYLLPQLQMATRELWARDPGNLGNLKIVDSPAFSGPHALQVSTPSVAVTNLISNPSFETNTTGWDVTAQANVNALANSITRTTGDFYVGAAAADVSFQAVVDSGARTPVTGSFVSGTTYSFYIAIKSLTGATDFRLKLVSTGSPGSLNVTKTFTATTSWQRIYMTATPTGTVSDVYLSITRASAAVATARIDAAMIYAGDSETPFHFDTSGNYFQPITARSDQDLDLSEFDGVGIFLFSPSVSFLGGITLRFLTQLKTLSNGDTDYSNLDGMCWFEYTIPGLSGDSVISYGSGVYGVARYASSSPSSIAWTQIVIPKSAFTALGNSGLPSWGDIVRTEVKLENDSGGSATLYVDEIAGWHDLDPLEAEANRMISMLPPFMWDTDPSRQFFQITGWELDRLQGTLDHGLDQRLPALASWELDLHEVERGIPPDQPGSLNKRRELVLHTSTQMATLEEFEHHLSTHFSDGGAQVTEYFSEYRVEVNIAVNSQTDRNRVLLLLTRLIPAHLQVSISYEAFLAGQIAGSALGPTVITGTTEPTTLTDTGSQP
jgi:hypothetical protein